MKAHEFRSSFSWAFQDFVSTTRWTLNEKLLKLRFESAPFDPCLYILRRDDGSPRGALGIHVDDGLRGGDEVFQLKLEVLQQKYPFGSQKMSDFIFTGIHLQQRSDMGIVLSQSE